ncbi:MAG: hypothetical protein U0414_29885 [Polyangiaceae bacterium]
MTNTKTVSRGFVLAAAALAIGLCACSSEPQFPETPDAGPPAPTPTPTPTPPPAPQVTDCDAGQQAQILSGFAGRVGTEAPKMTPEGPFVCGQIPVEGMGQTGPVLTIQPGMCYTALGGGLPSVQDVDIAVTIDASAAAGIPGLGALIAATNAPLMVDNIANVMTGANVKADGCFKLQPPFNLMGVPVRMTVKAHTGTGPVGAQLYSRKL